MTEVASQRNTHPSTIEERTEIAKSLVADPSTFPPLDLPGFVGKFFFERAAGILGSSNKLTVMVSNKHSEYAGGVTVKESDKNGKKVLTLSDGKGNEVALCEQMSDDTFKILGKHPLNEGDKEELQPSCYPWFLYTHEPSQGTVNHRNVKVWNGKEFVASIPGEVNQRDGSTDFFPVNAHLNLANNSKEQLIFALKQTKETTGKKGNKEMNIYEASVAPTADIALVICLAAIMEVSQ